MSYQDAGVRRDAKPAGGENIDVRFRKLPVNGGRNRLIGGGGGGGGGGREIGVEIIGKGGGRDGCGERSGFHFRKGERSPRFSAHFRNTQSHIYRHGRRGKMPKYRAVTTCKSPTFVSTAFVVLFSSHLFFF